MSLADSLRRRGKPIVLALAVLFSLLVAEAAARFIRPVPPQSEPARNRFCGACPELFELNPWRPDVSPQGLRDRSFSEAPEPGTVRILVVGDSVPYGPKVPAVDTFPKVMERALDGQRGHGRVEVLNSGVPAYSTWNERRHYLARLRGFRADLVVISSCWNDVADPLLHWASHVSGPRPFIPEEAFPNPAYHREQVLPRLAAYDADWHSLGARALRASALYQRWVAPVLAPGLPRTSVTAGGRSFPAYLVSEDTLGMGVLTEAGSPEWTWLRGQYDALLADIRGDGAGVMVVVNPLAYQLEAGYPLQPERVFAAFCAERGIRCLDVLPALRERPSPPLYVGGGDVWHYSSAGHRVVGEALAAFVEREGLLTPRAAAP